MRSYPVVDDCNVSRMIHLILNFLTSCRIVKVEVAQQKVHTIYNNTIRLHGGCVLVNPWIPTCPILIHQYAGPFNVPLKIAGVTWRLWICLYNNERPFFNGKIESYRAKKYVINDPFIFFIKCIWKQGIFAVRSLCIIYYCELLFIFF